MTEAMPFLKKILPTYEPPPFDGGSSYVIRALTVSVRLQGWAGRSPAVRSGSG